MTAARHSFAGLLIPGTMALVTAFVGFATLMLIPIPMIRELAITASIGVAYKIVTNLSCCRWRRRTCSFDDGYVARSATVCASGAAAGWAARRASPSRERARSARSSCAVLFGARLCRRARAAISATCSPARRSCATDSRYNRDAVGDRREVRPRARRADGGHRDAQGQLLRPRDDGVHRPLRLADGERAGRAVGRVAPALLAKQASAGFNEGNPKWAALPRDPSRSANCGRPRAARVRASTTPAARCCRSTSTSPTTRPRRSSAWSARSRSSARRTRSRA